MIVRPAQQKDLVAVQAIIGRCDLKCEWLNYAEWSGVLLVAQRQSEVVGFIAALPGKPYAVITEMGVLPEYQKGSAARRLLEGMELLLRQMGVTAWTAYVGSKRDVNETMPKLGCVSTGEGTMYLKELA